MNEHLEHIADAIKPNAFKDERHKLPNQAVGSTNRLNPFNDQAIKHRDQAFGASSTTAKGNSIVARAGKTVSSSTSMKRKRNNAERNARDEDAGEDEPPEEQDTQPRNRKRFAPSGNQWSNGKSRGEFAMINIDSKDLEAGGGRLVGRRGQLARAKAGQIGYGGDPNPTQNNFGYLPFATKPNSTGKKRAVRGLPKGSTAKRTRTNPEWIQSRGGSSSGSRGDDEGVSYSWRFS